MQDEVKNHTNLCLAHFLSQSVINKLRDGGKELEKDKHPKKRRNHHRKQLHSLIKSLGPDYPSHLYDHL